MFDDDDQNDDIFMLLSVVLHIPFTTERTEEHVTE